MASLYHQKEQLDEDLHTTDCTHSSGNTSSSSAEDGSFPAAATAGAARPAPSTPMLKGRIAELNGSGSSLHTPQIGLSSSCTELDAVQALMDLPSSPFRSPMRDTASMMSPAPSTFTRSPWWSPVPDSPFAGFADALSPILHSSAYCVSGAARPAAQPPLLSERLVHGNSSSNSSNFGIMSSPAAMAMRRSYMNSISSPLSSNSGLLQTPNRQSGGVSTPGSAFMSLAADCFDEDDHEMTSIISLAMMGTPDSARRTRKLQQKLFPETSADGFDSGLLSSPGGLTSALSWPVERHLSNGFGGSNGFTSSSAPIPPEQRQRMLSASDIHPGYTGLLTTAAVAPAAAATESERYYSPVASRLTRRAATRTSIATQQQQQQQQLYEERLAQQYDTTAPLTSVNDTSKTWTCEHYGDTDDEAEDSLNDLSTVLYRSVTKGKGRRKLSMSTTSAAAAAAAVLPTPAKLKASTIAEQLSVSAQKRRKRAAINSTPIMNTLDNESVTTTAAANVQGTSGASVSGSLRAEAMRRNSLAAVAAVAAAVAAAGGDTTDADTTFERDDDDDDDDNTTNTTIATKKLFGISTQQQQLQQQQQQQLQSFTSPLTSVGIREATMTVKRTSSNSSSGSPQHNGGTNIGALLQDSAMHTTPIANRILLQPSQFNGGAFSSPATTSSSVLLHTGAAMMSVEQSGRSGNNSSSSSNNTDDDESPESYRKLMRSSTSGSSDSPVVCNCKKSKCLKLYCDCFATSATCSSACNCVACENNTKHDVVRQEARRAVLDRNPAAFQIKAIDDSTGCSCKKSSCLKKYCECYRLGNVCTTDKCRCVSCKNLEGGECDLKRKSYANSSTDSSTSNSGNIIATALSSVMDICGVNDDYSTAFIASPVSAYSVAAVALEAAAAAVGNGTTGMTPAFTSKLNMFDHDDTTTNGDSTQQQQQQHTNNLRSPLVSAAMDYSSEANNGLNDDMQIDDIAIVPAPAAVASVNNKKKGKSKKTTANTNTTTTTKATTKASSTKAAITAATTTTTVVAVKDPKIRAFGRGSRSLHKSNVMSVMQHLDNDDLYNACLVSKMWANLALDDVLWQY
jgi:Tesmin/TSO1-like CXC domain, cysteine-rich domain